MARTCKSKHLLLRQSLGTHDQQELRIKKMTDYRHYHFSGDLHPHTRARVGIDRKYHRVRPEANIWTLGAVMWSLVTLREIEELGSKVEDILEGAVATRRSFDGKNVLKRLDQEIKNRYSPELWSLIQECTRLKPGDRPPPSRLLGDITAGLQKCVEREEERVRQTNDPAEYNVAFDPSHIHDLPDGGADFPKSMQFWHEFAEGFLWAPREWGTICPPDAPRALAFGIDGLPSPLIHRQQQRWREGIAERDRKRAAQNASRPYPYSRP